MTTRHVTRWFLLAVILAIITIELAAGQTPAVVSIDDRAQFLAGLPVSAGSKLGALEASGAGKDHAAAIEKEWTDLRTIRLDAMRKWEEVELEPRIDGSLPLVYLFGGPDFVSADVLYPSAPVYILAGLEPVGDVPPLDTISPEALATGLDNLRSSLRSMLRLSHFITKDMAADLRRTELKGVLPLLYLFLARTDNHLLDTSHVYIDREGRVVDNPLGLVPLDGVPGVRITFRSHRSQTPRRLYYFRMDLENTKVPAKPGFFPYLKELGPANSFLKAASFILHNSGFSLTRDFLLSNSRSILQDDSGIPFKSFVPGRWNYVFFGTYVAPESIFKGSFQPDLDKAFAEAAPTRPLPFSTGYSHTRKPSLMLAVGK